MHWTSRLTRRAGLAAAVLSAAALAACGPPPGAMNEGPAKRAGAQASDDCRSMKRRLDQMNAQKKSETKAYRDLLDTYLKRCFDR